MSWIFGKLCRCSVPPEVPLRLCSVRRNTSNELLLAGRRNVASVQCALPLKCCCAKKKDLDYLTVSISTSGP